MNNFDKNICILGNAFNKLSNGKNILSFSELINKINAKAIDLDGTTLRLEQGISEDQFLEISILMNDKCRIESYFNNFTRCSGKLTHKVNKYNTLISHPLKMSENEYASILMIDDMCAELSDHSTGQHIQFMILIEAARQLGNAVTEEYYSDETKIYLANALNINFIGFVYPFFTEIHYKVKDQKFKVDGNGWMLVQIGFMQFDKLVCEIEIKFSIFERKLIALIENSALNKIYKNYGGLE